MAKIPTFKAQNVQAGGAAAPLNPSVVNQVTASANMVAGQLGEYGDQLNKMAMQKAEIANNKELAIQKIKQREFEASVEQFIAANPGQPDKWEEFYNSAKEARLQSFGQDRQKWSRKMDDEYSIDFSVEMQAADIRFNARKTKEDVLVNNLKWEDIAKQNYIATQNKDQLENDLSYVLTSDEQRNILNRKIREEGAWERHNLDLSKAITVDDHIEFRENLLADEDIPIPMRNQLEAISIRQQVKIESSQKAYLSRALQDVYIGRFLSPQEIKQAVVDGTMSMEDVDFYQKRVDEFVRKEREKEAKLEAKEDRERTERTVNRANTEHSLDIESDHYTSIDDELTEKFLKENIKNPSIYSDEVESYLKQIENAPLGSLAKADLYAKLMESISKSIESDSFWENIPWNNAEGEDLSDYERTFYRDVYSNISKILKNTTVNADGIGAEIRTMRENINEMFKNQGDEKMKPDEYREKINEFTKPIKQKVIDKQIRDALLGNPATTNP